MTTQAAPARVRNFTTAAAYCAFLEMHPKSARNAFDLLEEDCHLIVMPDLSPDDNLPTGTCLVTPGPIVPLAVGADLGCGYGLWELAAAPTTHALRRAVYAALERHVGCTQEIAHRSTRSLAQNFPKIASYIVNVMRDVELQLAHGNHFVEIHEGQRGATYLIVHNGSLGCGYAASLLATRWLLAAGVAQQDLLTGRFEPSTPPYRAYRFLHDAVLEFARLVRADIATRVVSALKTSAVPLSDVPHTAISGTRCIFHQSGTQRMPKTAPVFIAVAANVGGYIAQRGLHSRESSHVIGHGVGPTSTPESLTGIVSNFDASTLDWLSRQTHSAPISVLEEHGLIDVTDRTLPRMIVKQPPKRPPAKVSDRSSS